jgi:uncharacterized membrane protein
MRLYHRLPSVLALSVSNSDKRSRVLDKMDRPGAAEDDGTNADDVNAAPQPSEQNLDTVEFSLPRQPYMPGSQHSAVPPQLLVQFGIPTQQSWNAPFPPPDVVERYEAILPGTFGRIIEMAELGQKAQMDLLTHGQEHLSRDVARGHYLGAFICLCAIGSAIKCVELGSVTGAALFLGVPLFSVVLSLTGLAARRSQQTSQKPMFHNKKK